MSRNIVAAQKRAQDFHKSDTLDQTSQIKYGCFFTWHRKHKKLFSQDIKIETKIRDTFF